MDKLKTNKELQQEQDAEKATKEISIPHGYHGFVTIYLEEAR